MNIMPIGKTYPNTFITVITSIYIFSAIHTLLKSMKEILSFYKDIHDLYMNNVKKEPTTAQHILEQSICLNDQITLNNKCIQFLKCPSYVAGTLQYQLSNIKLYTEH